MRLFVAINFSDETVKQLLSLRDELRSCSEKGRFSAPENMHLTLVFLGECDTKQTASAKAAMNGVHFEPFSISMDSVGRFQRNGGDIWWAGVQKSDVLLGLQKDLSDKLNDAGFALDVRDYSPHITLGREVVTDAKPRRIQPLGESVSRIELMKSERISGKLTYTAIHAREC